MKVSSTQSNVLAQCVRKAYDDGWSGEMRETSRRPMLRFNTRRSGVSTSTMDSMENKGLIAVTSKPRGGLKNYYVLTPEGVAVGEEYYEKKHGTTAQRAAQTAQDKAQAEREGFAARVAAVKKQFRGINLKRRTSGKKKSLGAHIDANFKRHDGYNRIELSLEDLEALGASIDKLR